MILPVAVINLLILPIALTGFPKRMQRQRDDLLLSASVKLNKVYEELSSVTTNDRRKELVEEMQVLSEEREIVQHNHSGWPFPAKAIRQFALVTIPALIALGLAFIDLIK